MVTPKRVLGAVIASCALAAALAGLTGAHAAARDLTAQRVSGWRAPGVRVAVTGWAAADARVVLSARGRIVATTTAGPRGRFQLGFATLRPGRYPLSVAANDETLSAASSGFAP